MQAVVRYGLMILFAAVVFLLIRTRGESLVAPVSAAVATVEPAATHNVFLRVLMALSAIIALGQLLTRLLAYVSQPPVIGEVLAGIMLGPSLLGPDVSALILPTTAAAALGVIGQLGIVLYMFLVGLELNPALLRHRIHSTVATSHASILLPFLLGSLLALFLYPRLSTSDVPFTHFALFVGVAMSVTAFPVLARVLADHKLTRSNLGVVALSCAAVDDVTAWCLLAVVIGIANTDIGRGLLVAAGAVAFIALMFLVARPFFARIAGDREAEQPSKVVMTVMFLALLVSAMATEAIGIHAIFGAFLLGTVIPHDSVAARSIRGQAEGVVSILLLPAFFALTGMRTRIDLLSEPSQWVMCGLIILVATAGKFGGTLIAGRITGLRWRSATILGALMNSRGLMELVVLNVGLDFGIISPTVFTMMVLMALVTTALTCPVLRLLQVRDVDSTLLPEPPRNTAEPLQCVAAHPAGQSEEPTVPR